MRTSPSKLEISNTNFTSQLCRRRAQQLVRWIHDHLKWAFSFRPPSRTGLLFLQEHNSWTDEYTVISNKPSLSALHLERGSYSFRSTTAGQMNTQSSQMSLLFPLSISNGAPIPSGAQQLVRWIHDHLKWAFSFRPPSRTGLLFLHALLHRSRR